MTIEAECGTPANRMKEFKEHRMLLKAHGIAGDLTEELVDSIYDKHGNTRLSTTIIHMMMTTLALHLIHDRGKNQEYILRTVNEILDGADEWLPD